MEVSIIKIGNSKGIRLSKTIIEKYEFTDKVVLEFKEDSLVLRPVKNIREGWDKAYKAMSKNKEDLLLIEDIFEDEDFDL